MELLQCKLKQAVKKVIGIMFIFCLACASVTCVCSSKLTFTNLITVFVQTTLYYVKYDLRKKPVPATIHTSGIQSLKETGERNIYLPLTHTHTHTHTHTYVSISVYMQSTDLPRVVIVKGLPKNQPAPKLSQRLSRLSDNCGGKVLQVNPKTGTARILFWTPELAVK